MKKIVSCLFASIILIVGICFSSAAFAQTDEEETTVHIHNYISEITKEATYAEDGIETLTCDECGDVQTEIIPATGRIEAPELSVSVNKNGSFTLSWNKVDGADKYDLYIRNADGSYKVMKTTADTSFITAIAPYGKDYSFKMKAVNNSNSSYNSEFSNTIDIVNDVKIQTPAVKVAVNANGTFKLSWNAVAGADKYDLYIRNDDGSYKVMKTTNATSFTTAVGAYGKNYSYKIKALNSNNTAATSDFSNIVSAVNNNKLSTPSLKLTENADGSFKLSWNAVAGADKYELYIRNADGSYKVMKTTTASSFTTAIAAYNRQYAFKMKAIKSNNSSINSAFSSTVTAVNNIILQTPALKITVNSNGSFKLYWGAVAGADKYELYIKNADGSYKLMKTTTASSFTTAVAAYGRQYAFKMRAVNSDDESITSKYSAVVNAKYAINSIKISQGDFTLGLKETSQLTVVNQDKVALNSNIKYSSSNSSIVSVSAKGVVTAKKTGTATITATYKDGKKATSKITVKNAPTSVSLNYTSATIGIGEKSLDLDSTIYGGYSRLRAWSSSNTKVASVNGSGVVTGVSEGTATITCTTYNGKKASCKVTVKKAPTSIAITNSNKKVQYGTSQYKIKTQLSSGSASRLLTYKSSNTAVAKVSSNGIVTGVKTGTADITVTAYNGIATTVRISVVNENNCLYLNQVATQVSYDYNNVTKYVFGKTYQGRNLEAYIITPTNGNYKKTYVMTFAIHGFEDSYSRDGKVLVEEGNKLVKYYAENPGNLGNFRLVIVPCLNPDGTIAGTNNKRACSTAFGRCTANHIDMNRDFMSGAFKATETKAMVNLLKQYRPDVFTDFHGWLNGTYGSSDLGKIFGNTLRLSDRNDGKYGATLGYIEGYVHSTYNCPSALVEYTSPGKVNHQNTYTAINRVIKHYS
ncbi:MAG: Ig-like domain-containing protein [Eubacterium sp.]|nr:Ig-like domain-containing protein [Eubacterium sp.]